VEDLVIGIIGLVLTGLFDLAFWALAAYLWFRRVVFLRRAVTIEGTCVGVRTTRHGEAGVGHDVYHPIVRWEDEKGRSHKTSCTRGDPMWDDMVGTPLNVLVLPGKPHTAIVEFDRTNLPKVITLLAVAFLLPVGMFLAVVLTALRDLRAGG